MTTAMPDSLDGVLILAQWTPHRAPEEDGSWGCCLAGDWARLRLGEDRWERIKAKHEPRLALHRGVAVEDALSDLMTAVIEAGAGAGMTMVSSAIEAGGGPGERVARVGSTHARGQGDAPRQRRARDAFFDGLPWAQPSGAARHADCATLGAALAHARQAWMDRAALEASLGPADAAEGSKRM